MKLLQPVDPADLLAIKKWFETLPADLQKIVREDAQKVSQDIVPFVSEFFSDQYKIWASRGGEVIKLPGAEQSDLIGKVVSVGTDLSQTKLDLNKAVMTAFESAKRNK